MCCGISTWIGVTAPRAAEAPVALAADEADAVVECAKRNLPHFAGSRTIRVAWSRRASGLVERRARILTRVHEGRRQAVVLFLDREEVASSRIFIRERETGREIYLLLSEGEKPKRLQGSESLATVAGTDFSAEDLAHLVGFTHATAHRVLDRRALGERSVHVVETLPKSGSAYDRVVSFIHEETCVIPRAEYYQGGRLRKQLSANPKSLEKKGPMWFAFTSLMEDVRDSTSSMLLIEEVGYEEPAPHHFDVALP